eukprot:CAMPEP_0183359550 /NCGR_PEP_ID=MMETSP0164_2-20130417/52565_1 /TAXON_ID=221442 /ORGANISM="Coccolithus pelagicus ssp braarudi, Strain PLY182g" /LENGTH=41 /DNA_ID= /DNA_START= /DNA_END= /DNA_ORIENTATION=
MSHEVVVGLNDLGYGTLAQTSRRAVHDCANKNNGKENFCLL